MDVIVKTKNCDVPARLKEEAVAKVSHATRFYDRLLGVEMVFGEEHNPRIPEPAVVEVTARTKGHHIRAEGHGPDHRAAIDVAVAKFERQLSRYKARLVDRSRRQRVVAPAAPAAGLPSPPVVSEDGQAAPRIVRTKRFVLQPMLPEDAALQLELLGHDFYLFVNAGTGQCNVVYRRDDGDLGLIVPAEEGQES